MIVGLTGFHSSGKTALAEFLASEFGWTWTFKRHLLKEWAGLGDDEAAWTAWYRELYSKMSSYEIMQHLLERMQYKHDPYTVIILDAIHTPGEWRAVKELQPNAILAGIFVPMKVRLKRSTELDLMLDKKREEYWHSSEFGCLLSQVEWAFSGTSNSRLRWLEAQALREYIFLSKKIG